MTTPQDDRDRIVERYADDERFADFDAGTVRAVMDYGDQYLVVSHNITGLYENQPPEISSIWCYTEAVYSMYKEDGTLLWRAAKDTSPDYDARFPKTEDAEK